MEIDANGQYDDLPSAEMKIRGRGNSTWNMPKKPYQIKLDDKEKVLDMPKDKKWILLAHFADKSLLRTETAFAMSRFSSLDFTPQSRFVEVFINVKYRGTYQITQKVEESSNRVDIGDDGYLLEIDYKYDPDDDVIFKMAGGYAVNIKEPNLDEGDDQYNYIKDYILNVEKVLYSDNFKDPTDGYRKYLDLQSFADWYIVQELTRNVDAAFGTSVYMNVIPGEKLRMGPLWDFDISMGNINYADASKTEGFYIKNSYWISRLFEDPYFVSIVQERMKYFNSKKTEIFNNLDKNRAFINSAQEENFKHWDILGKYVWPNYQYPPTYQEEIDYLKDWLEKRWLWLDIEIARL